MSAPILLVGDTTDTIELLTAWLTGEGHPVAHATSRDGALRLVAQDVPGLILVDLTSTALDGMAIYRQLRFDPVTSLVPCILITDRDSPDMRAEAFQAGATDVITKPVNLPLLSQSIATILTRPREILQQERTILLDQLAQKTLASLECDLVWLLGISVQENALVSRALARSTAEGQTTNGAVEALRTLVLPLTDHHHPLVHALMARQRAVNLPAGQLRQTTDALGLYHTFDALGLRYLSLLPLTVGHQAAGVLALGTAEPLDLDSQSRQKALAYVNHQAAMVIDYVSLSEHLADQEEMMHAEQLFLSTVLDTMGDGLAVIDNEGQIEYVNNRLLRMTDYVRREVLGRRIDLLFHPEDRLQLLEGLLHKRGATMKFDQRLYTQTGREIPVLLMRSPLSNVDQGATEQVIVVSDLTEQKRREEALERQSQQLRALNQAAQAITSSLAIHEVITEILNAAVQVVHSEGASILLRSSDNPNELIFVSAVGPQAESMYGLRVPFGQGIAGWVAREAKSQLVPDTSQDARFYSSIDQATGLTTRSLIAVPLITANEVMGVLEVINKQEGAFDQQDVDLLESMAGTAAVAIDNARLFDQTRRRLVELGTLLDASAAVSSTLDFGSVLELIARRLAAALHVGRCLITSWNRASNTLHSLAEVVNAYWPSNTGPVSRLAHLPLRHTALTSGQCVMAHVTDPQCEPEERSELKSLGQKAMLGVPLGVGGHMVGLVALYSSLNGYRFSAETANRAKQVAQTWQGELGESVETRWRDEAALTAFCNRLLDISGVTWVAVEMWEPEHKQTRRLRETGFALWTEQEGFRQPLDEFPTMRRVLSTANPKVVDLEDLEADPNEQNLLKRNGGQVCLMAPLIIRGAPQGLVKLTDTNARRIFETEEISLCQGIANVVGNAMENAHLYQSIERRAQALEAAYAELQQEDQLKGELLQNLSHEIQTPLLHILGYVELTHDGSFGPLTDEQREHLEFVVKRARHLSELVKDIISVHALQTEQMEMRPTDLESIIRQTIRTWAAHATQRDIMMEAQIAPNLPLVLADPMRLAEALDHLVDNAIKFSPDHTRVEIGVSTEDAVLTVYVRDQGMGIPPEVHERVFHRFYQVDGSATRQLGGTGLGLAIVREIILQHGGRIWVESEPDRGSTFLFTLPRTVPPA